MSDNEQLPPVREIPMPLIAKTAVYHGYQQFVLIAIREGDEEGATAVVYGGLTAHDKLKAEAMAQAIKQTVLGWGNTEEAAALDAMVKEAKREMADGPGNDPDYGKKLIVPIAERIAKRERPAERQARIDEKMKVNQRKQKAVVPIKGSEQL